MLTRRSLLGGLAVGLVAAPAIVRAQGFRDYPFALGVAAGDPAADGFVIWTRLAPDPLARHGGMALLPVEVEWEVAEDDRFQTIAAAGTALARPELAHAVHVEVQGLKPHRPYWYRFKAAGEQSLRGRATTLPLPGASPERLRFGVAGCNNLEDGWFTGFRHLAREELDFVYHYGDFIYEYRQNYEYAPDGLPLPTVRRHVQRELIDTGDYRAAYAQYCSDIDLQAARAQHTWLSSFDDHEVLNNFVGNQAWAMDPKAPLPAPEVFALRRQAAMQAWYEHMPVRRALLPRGPGVALHRGLNFGDLAAIQLLDTRQYRSDQPCGDGFKPACPEVAAPGAQVLGAEQEAWAARRLADPAARWQVLAQQVMMMSLDRRRRADEPERILNLDSWAGYAAPRDRMLARMADRSNVVVLTGDEHQNWAGDLVQRDRVVGAEIVATSISSGGDGADVRRGSDVILANNPELKFVNDQRGYVVNEVTREAFQAHFMVMDQVTTPGAAIRRRATATIADRRAGVTVAA